MDIFDNKFHHNVHNLVEVTERQFTRLLNKGDLIKIVGDFVYDAADQQFINEKGVVLAERKVYHNGKIHRADKSIIDLSVNPYYSYESLEYEENEEDGYPFDFLGSNF